VQAAKKTAQKSKSILTNIERWQKVQCYNLMQCELVALLPVNHAPNLLECILFLLWNLQSVLFEYCAGSGKQ
jgi:hypothetical protein